MCNDIYLSSYNDKIIIIHLFIFNVLFLYDGMNINPLFGEQCQSILVN